MKQPEPRPYVHSRALGWASSVAVLLVLLTGCAQNPETKKQRYLSRGEGFLAEGKHNEAIIELKNALQVDPKFTAAVEALARAYRAKGWPYDAAREFGRAVELRPDDRDVRIAYARALIEIEAWAGAGAQAEFLRRRQPEDPETLYLVGVSLLGQDRTQEAVPILADAVKRAGTVQPAYEKALGDAYVRLGRTAEAEQAYQRALTANPKEVATLVALAQLARGRGQVAEEAQFVERARAVDPANVAVRIATADLHIAADKLEAATSELEAIPERARTARIVVTLGQLYVRSGRAGDAVRFLAPVVQANPQFASARYVLGHAYLADGKPTSALEQFQQVRRVSDVPLARFSLGVALVAAGRAREGLGELNVVATSMDRVPEYHFQLARAQAAEGSLDQATRSVGRFLTLAPDNPRGYLLLGNIEAQRGNVKKAEALYARAVGVDSGFSGGHVALGHLYALDKRPDEALREFDAALHADPTSLAAIRMKAGHLVREKRIPDAVKLMQDAAAARPREAALAVMLGNLYLLTNEPRKAEVEFRRAVAINEKSADARLGLARVAVSDRKEADAVGYLQRVLQDSPQDLRAALLLAQLHTRAARYPQAAAVIEPFAQGTSERPELSLLLADLQLKASRYDAVIERVRPLLARDPNSIPARTLLALALLGKANVEAAMVELERVKAQDPKLAATHYYLGRARLLRGDTEGARKALEQALALEPNFALARLELAALGGDKRDEQTLVEQIDRLKSAIAQDAGSVSLRHALASAYRLRGMRAEAEAEYQRILELAPTFALAQLGLATLRLEDRRPDEAAPLLESVLKTRPNDVRVNLLLADYYEAKGKRERAAERLEVIHRLNPGLDAVKLRLANLYGATGRAEAGIKLAQEVLAGNPKVAGAHLALGQIFMTRGRAQEAMEPLTSALRLDPRLVSAQVLLAGAYQRLGQHDRAIAEYQKAQGLSPDNPGIANNLAYLYAAQGQRLDEALRLAKHAHERLPDNPSVLDTLGYVHFRRGDYTSAEPVLRRATELPGASAVAHYHLGMTYYKLGRLDDASASLRRALQGGEKLSETDEIHRLLKEIAKAS